MKDCEALDLENRGEFQKYLAELGDWWHVSCEEETPRILTGTNKWSFCLQRSYRMGKKKGEVVWGSDKKDVNRHNESDIMLGYRIGTIYQKVRYVRIPPSHFGSWNHESRSEGRTEKLLKGIVSTTRKEYQGGNYQQSNAAKKPNWIRTENVQLYLIISRFYRT